MYYELLTVMIGLCMGIWFSKNMLSTILIVFYHRNYGTEEGYLNVYNLMDEEFNFEMMKNSKYTAQDYSEFLLRHQAARQYAYGYFSEIMQSYKRIIFKYTLGIFVFSLVFYKYWYVIALTCAVVFIGFVVYERYVKKHGAYLYIQIMLLNVFDMYNASEHLLYKELQDIIQTPDNLKNNKTYQKILDIELGFWRVPGVNGGYVKKHFAPKGIFVMPSPDGEWVYLTKKKYFENSSSGGLQEIFHKVTGINFVQVSKDLAVISYKITAIYETGRDYRVMACSTFKKNPEGNWQQLIHQQGYAKF